MAVFSKNHTFVSLRCIGIFIMYDDIYNINNYRKLKVKVNQPHYRPAVAQMVPGS